MKHSLYSLLVIVAVSLLPSCKKFLQETSPDLVKPTTVAHYKELLQGDGYYEYFYYGWFIELMTDNVTHFEINSNITGLSSIDEKVMLIYQWAKDPEDLPGNFTDDFFKYCYRNILTTNNCLLGSDNAIGTEAELNVLKGQSYFQRAYGYFLLANLYAQAFNEANPEDLCVPINTETAPTPKRFNRASIKEVWDLISSDIEKAIHLLEQDKVDRPLYEVSFKSALLLGSRIALFMNDFDKVIDYGEKFLAIHPELFNITQYTQSPDLKRYGPDPDNPLFFSPNHNPEAVFAFGLAPYYEGSHTNYTNQATNVSRTTFSASMDVPGALLNLYGPNDRRKNMWFAPPTPTNPGWKPVKYSAQQNSRRSQYMRSGEVYLTLAEAYARKNLSNNQRVLELLNALRRNRIEGYTDLSAANFSNQQALIDFIWEERRRELCFEEYHRWWDLRRTGQPSLEHFFLGKKYVLQEKDPAYLMNFPKKEFEFNPELIPNFRPVRNPI